MNDFREYSAAFHEQNDDLRHYGVLGMKWGRRKNKLTAGENARQIEYNLNTLDRQKARNSYAMDIASRKISKLTKKSDRLKAKGKHSKRIAKKLAMFQQHYKETSAARKEAERMTNKILKNKNYDIQSKDKNRINMTPGQAALGALTGYYMFDVRKGKKYKVRRKA